MAGNRSRRKPARRQELEDILSQMETYLEGQQFDKLDQLADKFEQKLDLAIKEGSVDAPTLKRFLEVLKHLEQRALEIKEELKESERKMKKLKNYGDFA